MGEQFEHLAVADVLGGRCRPGLPRQVGTCCVQRSTVEGQLGDEREAVVAGPVGLEVHVVVPVPAEHRTPGEDGHPVEAAAAPDVRALVGGVQHGAEVVVST